MKKHTQLLSALALSVGLTLSAPFPALASIPGQATLPSLAPMLEKVLPAVVSVKVEGTAAQSQKVPEEFKKFFGEDLPDQPSQPFEGLGSGVIIDAAKGYVLTNNHVINQAQKISIQLNDGREFDAKLIGGDDQSDIALLQIQNPSKLTQIAIADSDKLRVGDFAVAVGNPFGLGQTATSGIISALGRSGLNLEGLENFIQTDASINRGNSGGALLNLNGELIGINTAILAPGGGSIGIGFAIPSNMAQTLAQQLIQFGEIKRGLLGIKGTEMTADIAKAFKLNVQRGAFVSEVLPNSGSAKAGVKSGDVIISLNGKQLNSFAELRSRIATTEPGTKVKLGLLRDGKPLEVEVTLDSNTSSSASAEMIAPALQGATLSDGQLKDGTKGVKVDSVEKSSPAAQAGLQKDDVIIGVNRDRISSIAEMRKVMAAKPSIIALQVVRGNENIYLLLR
ncbi:TPA: serine endoprotease DegQ [Salmonella enterica subsp. enterica serovar Thompson]|uniref:serine endoprotease DegQ n=1 Tax=Salmonella enterica TaxID=28901 RepID=UPI000F9BB3B4|nr:serine endoprotease DegQ [Salmonella enterica]EAA6822587.1 serine endoprotease DegQ [Salmonella enterica subsp. enterica serovar Corvallis]EAW1753152.1 serine endoprotease DegQ [Salmonella enterica subsp. enterica]EBV7176551.1 serine endoprotease DegQ [Salmonella enterica subsp. enterica serovar Thompson]EDE1994213.1 serine endoprotease DegQ [Salmonella enterica subsp. enterica serovar Hissar]EDQ7330451.1 serine endoprotease DegQ [Salmonella enterica subsp. enterica serovar Paratyphi C]EEJ